MYRCLAHGLSLTNRQLMQTGRNQSDYAAAITDMKAYGKNEMNRELLNGNPGMKLRRVLKWVG